LYEKNPDLKSSLAVIDSMSNEQKKLFLQEQCSSPERKDEPFCEPEYVSGALTFDQIIIKKTSVQFEEAMLQALNEVKNNLLGFVQNIPLVLIMIVSAILGVLFYILADGAEKGIGIFLGNTVWLMFMSAISFKLMPFALDKMTASMTSSVPAGSEGIAAATKDIVLAWFAPAINSAFMATVWITIIIFVMWLGYKLYRKYDA
jgi:hypothetical protein